MPKPIFSTPEDFSISPLLQLLPVKSKVAKLETLNSSLYARYEKVSMQIRDIDSAVSDARQTDNSEIKTMQAELLMLKQVLDWLDITPEKQ